MESKYDESEDVQMTKQEVDIARGEASKLLFDTGDEDDVNLNDGEVWKIRKYVNGNLTSIHDT